MRENTNRHLTILACSALLIALDIILTRFLAINTQFLRISLGMIPVAVAGMAFGPLWGGLVGAIGDVLGMLIFPSGAYFPGFTLTAALTGIVYALFVYKKEAKVISIALASVIVCIGLNLLLDTLWLNIMYGSGFLAILPARAVKCIINIPIYTIILHLLWTKVLTRIPGFRDL
ncbi:MAG: folate family ECF transporter S component [Firmicutes bacterium]|nr:folate family ECF transporter S component [Bacillota bacterium]